MNPVEQLITKPCKNILGVIVVQKNPAHSALKRKYKNWVHLVNITLNNNFHLAMQSIM